MRRVGDPPVRVVVLAPHPDDETLRLTAVVLRCRAAGDRLTLLAASDGGASNAARKLGWSPERESEYRRMEQAAAWSALTGGAGGVVRLGLADGDVDPAGVLDGLRELAPTLVYVAAHPSDGHRDHVACAQAAAACGAPVTFALEPGDHAGERVDVPPPLLGAARLAHEAYARFGHRSVKRLFREHRRSGYASWLAT